MTGTTADYQHGYLDGRDDARQASAYPLDVLMRQGYPSRYIAGYEAGALSVFDEQANR